MNLSSSQADSVSLHSHRGLSENAAHGAERMSRDDIRLKLLDAALEVLLCKGIQAFTQARVAERAGVRQSHLTYYFPTRSDLLKAVVESGSQVVLETMGASSAMLPPTLEDFRHAMAEHVSGTRMPRLMMALSVASDEDPTLKLWMAEFESRIQENMRLALLHYGLTLDANELALFHATVVGISVLNVNASTKESSQQAGRMFVMAFDRLLKSKVAVKCLEDHQKIASRKVVNRSRIKKAVKVEGEV